MASLTLSEREIELISKRRMREAARRERVRDDLLFGADTVFQARRFSHAPFIFKSHIITVTVRGGPADVTLCAWDFDGHFVGNLLTCHTAADNAIVAGLAADCGVSR